MNKACLAFLILGSLPFLSRVAFADGPVTFPTGNAAWMVDIQDHSSANQTSTSPANAQNPPARHPQHVEVTQVNNVKKIVITWSDGKTTQKWTIPGLNVVFEEDPRDGVVTPFRNASERMRGVNAELTYDSFAFDWVAPGYLQEKDPINYQGKQCFHYKGPKEAWIDSTTLLPVALDNGTSLSSFTFAKVPPTGPLIPPKAFAIAIHYYKITMGYP